MASGASSTDGAVYASLAHVALIIVLAVFASIFITIGMGKLHRIANPTTRTERDGILLLRLKMLAAWPVEYLALGWAEIASHRWWAISFYRGRHRQGFLGRQA